MLKNTPAKTDDYGTLVCPKCGETYLHQGNTTIYERHEDAEWTTVMTQNGASMSVTASSSAEVLNPSSRRHGLLIEFVCEHCNMEYNSVDDDGVEVQVNANLPPFRLAIYQHKGNTFMKWVE